MVRVTVDGTVGEAGVWAPDLLRPENCGSSFGAERKPAR